MSLIQLLLALILVAGITALVMAIRSFGKSQHANSDQLQTLERQIDRRLAGLEQLEQRIAVLEKIVTDRRFELDEQFRDLNKTG